MCEGRVTEKEYLRAFQHHTRNPRLHVKVADETGVPLTVVQTAVRLRDEAEQDASAQHDENLRWDQVWGVFDVDDHPNLEQAVSLADQKGIGLAVSNPCFELWALLHFQDHRAYIDRAKVSRLLRAHIPGYTKKLDFHRMHDGYSRAVQRAQELEKEAVRDGDSRRNPSTGVHKLTEAIRTG